MTDATTIEAEMDIQQVSVDDIELDPENPRLPNSLEKSEPAILSYLVDEASIQELMQAIGENGFFPGEPIVVVPGQTKKYRVIEGNRRLASVILLKDPSKVDNRPSIKQASDDALFRPDTVPVVVFKDADEVMAYLGYRHITGVKAWEPLAKARYLSRIFHARTQGGQDTEQRLRVAARYIGSRPTFVRRTLTALALFNLIESKDYFGIEGLSDRNLAFSLLSTAVSFENLLDFLGADADPISEPDQLKQENVERFARWAFERGKDGRTRLGESRDLKKLAAVVSAPVALQQFAEKGATLEQAWRLTRAVAEEFDQHLNAALAQLATAASLLPTVDSDDTRRKNVTEIYRYARHLKKTLADED